MLPRAISPFCFLSPCLCFVSHRSDPSQILIRLPAQLQLRLRPPKNPRRSFHDLVHRCCRAAMCRGVRTVCFPFYTLHRFFFLDVLPVPCLASSNWLLAPEVGCALFYPLFFPCL
ncbi:hypothetical protein K438DRAFT_1192370 [Mycena galopus ATCC 62051]|nr:hypothetical protein K438DRAFT_1192370 [Mycena galopus ATCC 62051]